MFLPPGSDHEAALFYHEIARLADGPSLTSGRGDLRDRARLGLAAKLRQNSQARTRPGAAVVSALLGGTSTWSPAAVRDAEYALTTAPRRAIESLPAPPREALRVPGTGHVTAACVASETDEFFLGFDGGEVFCFRPRSGEIVLVASYELPVASLATRPDGQSLVVLRAFERADQATLSTYSRRADGAYRLGLGTRLDRVSAPWLSPILVGPTGDLVGLWSGGELSVMEVGTLVVREQMILGVGDHEVATALILPPEPGGKHPILLSAGGQWQLFALGHGVRESVLAGGIAAVVPGGSTLRHPHVATSCTSPGGLDVAWIGDYGTLCWASFHLDSDGASLVSRGTSGQTGGYRAAVMVKPGRVAGLAPSRIDLYRVAASSRPSGSIARDLGEVVAGFACRRTGEVIAFTRDGGVRRAPVA
jgi:hypothetical protein